MKITIIGAGAAGLIAADILSAAGCTVQLYDQAPSFGRKFLLAGRGGLNLTHSEEWARFLSRYEEATGSLLDALNTFACNDLREWCHGLGEPTFIGSSGRVFPTSFKTSPLLRALLARLISQGVQFYPRHTWLGWNDNNALVFSNTGQNIIVKPEATLLALGGASWPKMGSNGAWVDILARENIDIAPLKPANCGFIVEWSDYFRNSFHGTPLKRIALNFGSKSTRAEIIITQNGIEGGGIYALSKPIRDAVLMHSPQVLELDLRPDLTLEHISDKLKIRKKGASLATHLRKNLGLNPVSIALLRECYEIMPDDLAKAIKSVPIKIISTAPIDRAISTAGGVKFSEVDDDFRLLKKPGVFVAGEMLDWEAPTGGYLLQACFATGARAARGILKTLDAQP